MARGWMFRAGQWEERGDPVADLLVTRTLPEALQEYGYTTHRAGGRHGGGGRLFEFEVYVQDHQSPNAGKAPALFLVRVEMHTSAYIRIWSLYTDTLPDLMQVLAQLSAANQQD